MKYIILTSLLILFTACEGNTDSAKAPNRLKYFPNILTFDLKTETTKTSEKPEINPEATKFELVNKINGISINSSNGVITATNALAVGEHKLDVIAYNNDAKTTFPGALTLIATETKTKEETPEAKKARRDSIKAASYDGKFKDLGGNYTQARVQMYGKIFNKKNKITGVYGGYVKNHTYGSTGSNPHPINCEHTVPQSFFNKKEPMKSDIHHLFPTHGTLNSARSNYRFAEIPDTKTEKWLVGTGNSGSTIPTTNIDSYSEFYNNTFEPREDHKGNVARAIFYFFTMYPEIKSKNGYTNTITNVADIETLKQWHKLDPVDADEKARQGFIEAYQGNRNPYVDDESLVEKSW
jgi:endonuclease I